MYLYFYSVLYQLCQSHTDKNVRRGTAHGAEDMEVVNSIRVQSYWYKTSKKTGWTFITLRLPCTHISVQTPSKIALCKIGAL